MSSPGRLLSSNIITYLFFFVNPDILYDACSVPMPLEFESCVCFRYFLGDDIGSKVKLGCQNIWCCMTVELRTRK